MSDSTLRPVVILVLFVVFAVAVLTWISPGNSPLYRLVGIANDLTAVPGSDQNINRISVPDPPAAVSTAFNDLVRALNTQSKEPCIIEYMKGGLPSLEKYQIEFLPQGDKRYLAQLRGPDGRVAAYEDVYAQLCVVGGVENGVIVAENFYKNWIECENCGRKNVRDNKQVKTVIIQDANNFLYDDIPAGKEDGGLLYVPESGKVCLVATVSSALDISPDCEPQTDGLEQDCLDTSDEVSALIQNIGLCG